MTEKLCSRCKRVKPLEDFPRARRVKSHGRHSYCRACHREWYEDHKDSARESNRRSLARRRYGLTLEEYDGLIAQGCSVCGSHERRIFLDHDHKRNVIREPLCSNCNAALGLADDDPERLEALAAYLRRMQQANLQEIPVPVELRSASLRLAWAEGRQRSIRVVVTEEELRGMYFGEGLSQAQIAKRLDCSASYVTDLFKKHGIAANAPGPRKKYDIDEDEVRRLYTDGVRVKDIAAKFGCSTMPIYVVLRRLGLRRRAPYARKAA